MVKNTIQFIVDESGQILNTPVGKVKAQTNLSNRIQLITPATTSTGVAVNYNIYDSRNLKLKQYLKPSTEKGHEVIDKASPLYQIAHDWNVFYCDIYSTALSAISKYRSGKVGISFDFYETVPGDLAVTYKGKFGFGKDLPETATDGDYYICDSYNYWLNGTLYNKGDVLVWVADGWTRGEVNNIALTSTYDISIDPTIYYESQEVSDEASQIIGEIAGDVEDLQANLNNNYYDKTESDARFVHLIGNETIDGTKTFTDSPIIPNASANMHAVNRSDMYNYTYSKGQIRDLTQAVVFETQAQFENWLAGTYTRPDGYTPADLIVGKTVIIEETSPNWLCIHTPATSLADFEEKAEDVKFLSEINAMPYKDITANNGQAFVNELKDQIDLKAQIIELEDLTIETTDWIDDSGNIYFDYENENFTDPTKQFFEFVSNNKDQNEAIANDGFSILALETILDGTDYKVRLFANKVPSIDIVLKVNLINYTNEVFEAGEITANKIIYSNTTSGLIATDVQGAIDELEAKISTTQQSVSDLASTTQQSVNNLQVDLDTVRNLIPTQINLYFTEATQTLFGKSFRVMQQDKPTDPISNIDTTITATTQETAQVLARFTTIDGLSSEVNLPPQNTEVNIQANRIAGSQNIRIFARGYLMDDAGNETLLSTSNVATLTDVSVNHVLPLPIPAYTAPAGSRVIIEILAYRVSGSGTHTARIRVNDDTMSKWSYNLSLADLKLDAKNIIYNNATSGLTATNVQDALDELKDEVNTKQDELISGVNIKTVNNISLLGSGNITIFGGGPFLKDPDKTYLVIKTPADNDTFELLTGDDGSPNYIIEWGDGTSENITTTDNPSHEYEKAGMYLITISGNFENGIMNGFSANENKNKIIEVYGGNNYPLLIGAHAFRDCTSLTTANFPNATIIDDSAFHNCTSLTTANFSNATFIGDGAFVDCTSLKELTIGNVTTTDTGITFQNVKLINLTIAQDVTSTDIDRIKQFYANNGGTFTGAQINSIE
jgi:hypothetical protein